MLFAKGYEVRLVKAKKDYKCWACNETLPKGRKYAYHKFLDGKRIITTKLCEPCYVGLVSLRIEFDYGVFPPTDIIAENQLKTGDFVQLLDDGCGLYDDGSISLKSQQKWKVRDINRKTTNGMYANICTKYGKSTAYQLSNLIKVFN